MHARHYTPYVGRFLQVDPILGRTSSPQSWNRYAYAGNDPVNFTDPRGLLPKSPHQKLPEYGQSITVIGNPYWVNTDTIPGSVLAPLAGFATAGRAVYGTGIELADLLYNRWLRSQDGGDDDDGGGDGGTDGGGTETGGSGEGCVPVGPSDADVNLNIIVSSAVVDAYGQLAGTAFWTDSVRPGGQWDYKTETADQSIYQKFGNFNYGATGHAIGLPDFAIAAGSAAAHVWENGLQAFSDERLAWEVADQQMIRQGIRYAERGGCD